jgi:tetratricopeptide (TPR) repeat protein
MQLQSSAALSPHKDVLEASIPETDSSQQALLDELKRRGKAAVLSNQWPDAALLYTKALECCSVPTTTTDSISSSNTRGAAELAILHANVSLCQGKVGGWEAALHHAKEATSLDDTYVKGWWRLGQAHAAQKRYDDAVAALHRAVTLEPTNKALQKELTRQMEARDKAKKEDAERAAAAVDEAANSSLLSNKKSASVSKNAAATTENKGEGAEPMEIIDDTEFTKSDHIKGYKIVNGKKTSYFHNELSEEAKILIGDIAPKKLDPNASSGGSTASTAEADGAPTTTGTSAWNKAGTWEEKDCTSWAAGCMQKHIEVVTYRLPASSPAPNATIAVQTSSVTGHASVATVRGKKRYIYELVVLVHWTFTHDTVTASGTLTFPDIDGTCMVGDGYEVTKFDVEASDDNNLRPVLETFVKQQGFRHELEKAIDDWVGVFKETY